MTETNTQLTNGEAKSQIHETNGAPIVGAQQASMQTQNEKAYENFSMESLDQLIDQAAGVAKELAGMIRKLHTRFHKVKGVEDKIEAMIMYNDLTFRSLFKMDMEITRQGDNLRNNFNNALTSAEKVLDKPIEHIKI